MNKILFNDEGYPLYFYNEDTYPSSEDGLENPEIPVGAVPVTDAQWRDAGNGRLWRSPDGTIKVPPDPEPVEPEPVVTILPAVTLWERMTENEAIAVSEAMKTQSVRTVQIFNNATTFRSDHELWPLLEQMATELFGEVRASELLAP